jgi:hypothetical protein
MLVLMVAVATSCSEPTRYSPPAVEKVVPPPVTVLPPGPFPAVSKPGMIYAYDSPLGPAWSSWGTRYVLYDDGTHALQFAVSNGAYQYMGRWTRADSTILFTWDGWSTAGEWGATGTVRGEQLVVKYNIIMQLTDFEDAIYVRVKEGS